MSFTSFCADAGYEMVLAVLPGFAVTIGLAASALGWIEGASDALASFVKFGAGWYSDRIGRRKEIVTLGYLLARCAMPCSPMRRHPKAAAKCSDCIAPATPPAPCWVRWRASGCCRFCRARLRPRRRGVFLISLIPGLAAVGSMLLLVREARRRPNPALRLWKSVRELPRPFARLLRGVGLFGLGDFSHTLLIRAAARLLTPAHGVVRAGQIGALLYALRNATYAAAAFPVGALADRMDKRTLPAAGYAMGAVTGFATAALFAARATNLLWLILLCGWAGLYIVHLAGRLRTCGRHSAPR